MARRTSNEQILRKHGWTLECSSPLEIRKDESFATGEAAQLVIDTLRQEDQTEEERYQRALAQWFAGKHRLAVLEFQFMDSGWIASATLDILDRQSRAFVLFFAEFLMCYDKPHTMQNVPEGVRLEELT